MEIIFWIATFLIVYIYVGYPLLLKLLPSHSSGIHITPLEAPEATVLIAAYNEAAHIESTLRNKLEQNYPADRLKVIVISDESTDGTDAIVERIAAEDSRVSLLRQLPRQGKTSALNLAMHSVHSDILVFSDANSIYHPDAIHHLVEAFQDQSVGYVTGKMIYVTADGQVAGDGCSAYMKYENLLRRLETRVSSVVGVDGGIDAMRRELYQPMQPDQLPDFVQPLKVITQGKRVIYCEKALLNEETLEDDRKEFNMRVRVSLRAYWAMSDMRHLFNPKKYGVFSLQLISHKLLRYLAFFPLYVAFVSNGFITGNDPFYVFSFVVQLVFYSAAATAAISGRTQHKLLRLPYYFCLINIASAIAFSRYLRGEKIVLWKPRGGQENG